MIRNISIALGVVALLMMAACKKTDTVKPTIDTFKINEKDHDITAEAGTSMHLDVAFSDNEALREFKVDIHDGFDGHGHGKINDFQKFSFQKTFELSGKEATEHKDIEIPANAAAGPYHSVVRVLDEEGNEGDFAELDFMITNDGQAEVNITDPDFSNEVHADKGTQLTLEGTITDDEDLDEIFVSVAPEEDHDHGKQANEGHLYEAEFELTGSSDTSWDFAMLNNSDPIDIPGDAETGYYVLKVVVTDSDGNMTIWRGEIHVM